MRIDSYLTKKHPGYSRSYFQYLIDNGAVLVSGKKVKKKHLVTSDDDIKVDFLETLEISVAPEDIPLNVLYEDGDIIVINKPINMVVHPAPGSPNHTLVNALVYHCQLQTQEDPLRPGIVHRLDKDTSGIIIAAKTTKAHRRLVEMFANREVKKEYLALSVGKPSHLEVNAPIARHPGDRKKMAIIEDGKSAFTSFEILESKGELTLLKARPITGRTHQIRVHLKSVNAPILGDQKYGSISVNKRYKASHQYLHSYSVEFDHPITNEPMKVTTSLPDFALKFLEQ